MSPRAKKMIGFALGLLVSVILLSNVATVKSAGGDSDATFNPGSGADSLMRATVLQPDGKILIGRSSDKYNGTARDHIARLLPESGAISFSAANYSVREGTGATTVTLTRTGGTDNKVVARVALTDDTASPADHGLTPGTIDATFSPAANLRNSAGAVALQPDGKVLIAEPYPICAGISIQTCLGRLNADGSPDTSFETGTGADSGFTGTVVQPDGKIIISGSFQHYNGVEHKSLVRLQPNGAVDTTFNSVVDVFSPSIFLQKDGKLLVGGRFDSGAYYGVVRLNADGSLDTSFNRGTGGGSPMIIVRAVQPDGKIIVTGDFTQYNGVALPSIVRLNPDGSTDTTFTPTVSAREYFYTVVVQEDGKILLGGIGGDSGFVGVIRRLNPDGTEDPSFNPGTGANLGVYTAALTPDNKIVIGGNFTSYNGIARSHLARLNSDGSLDTSFNANSITSGPVYRVMVQGDGRFIGNGGFVLPGNISLSFARVEGDTFVTWPAGDASNKTVSISIADDSILEPSESLSLSLASITGGATVGINPTATLAIVDNDTAVSAVSGSGIAHGTATLKATLSVFNSGLSGKIINFTLFGIPMGTAVTDANGVATLSGVSISSFGAANYSRFINATFAGDSDYSGSNNIGDLVVSPVYSITGQVKDSSNNPVGGVLITFEMNSAGTLSTKTTQTDASGNYSSGDLGSQNSVKVTPSKSNTQFNPGALSFTSTNSLSGSDTANFTALTSSSLPVLQFSQGSYTVGEAAGSGTLTVSRQDASSAATVDYATTDSAGLSACSEANTGKASSRCDYVTTVGTLRFSAGETSKTISVPIVDDGYIEGSESFTVFLQNPQGAALSSVPAAVVTITDNDTTASNPIVGVPFFVRQQYIDFLGREPDPGGYAAWQNILNNCAQGDTTCDRISVSSGFFRSPEFQDRGYFIYRFYRAALGRKPSYAEFIPDLGRVSGFLNDTQLEANKVAFVQEFMTRAEFANRYGSLSNAAFVDALIQTSGLQISGSDWVAQLNNGGMTKAQVLRALAELPAAYNKFYNEAFVVMQYFGYLRRDPDASYLAWIQTLNANGNDYRAMISGFINSNEYVLRFGP